MKKIIINVLLFIWQIFQNVLGLILILINLRNVKANKEKGCFMVDHLSDFGISLGNYVILDRDGCYCNKCINHEKGHQKQSLYLGWFYLIVIGLPSLCGNIWSSLFHKNWSNKERIKWYYSLPWEHWADKLGGVDRGF